MTATQEKRKKGDSSLEIYIHPCFYITNCKKEYHMMYCPQILCYKSVSNF